MNLISTLCPGAPDILAHEPLTIPGRCIVLSHRSTATPALCVATTALLPHDGIGTATDPPLSTDPPLVGPLATNPFTGNTPALDINPILSANLLLKDDPCPSMVQI